MTDYAEMVARLESGNNYDARPGTGAKSSAAGRYQFTHGTWHDLMGDAPMTPENQDIAFGKLTGRNRAILTRALGREPDTAELYAAHNLGPQGAIRVIENPDDTSHMGEHGTGNNADYMQNLRNKFMNITVPVYDASDVNHSHPIKSGGVPVMETVIDNAPAGSDDGRNWGNEAGDYVGKGISALTSPLLGFASSAFGQVMKGAVHATGNDKPDDDNQPFSVSNQMRQAQQAQQGVAQNAAASRGNASSATDALVSLNTHPALTPPLQGFGNMRGPQA